MTVFDDQMDSIVATLTERRKGLQIKQSEMAELLGTNQQEVSRLEINRHSMSLGKQIEMIQRYAVFVGTKVDFDISSDSLPTHEAALKEQLRRALAAAERQREQLRSQLEELELEIDSHTRQLKTLGGT